MEKTHGSLILEQKEFMNRSELVLRFAQRRGISKAAAQRFINAIFDEMIQALDDGEHVEFRGFGTLHCRTYESYVGRNPKTGENVEIQPRRRVRYKMSENILKKLNVDIEHFEEEFSEESSSDGEFDGVSDGESEESEEEDSIENHSMDK